VKHTSLFVLVALLGCSTPDPGSPDVGARDGGHDVGPIPDGGGPIDASPPIDAPPPIDAATVDAFVGPRPGACDPALPAPTPGTQTARAKGTTCAALGYYEYVPPDYASRHDWPLLLEFHGDGERGNGTTDLANLLHAGLPAQIERDHWDPGHRFVVLSPQMDDRGGLPERNGPSVRDFIAFASANYEIDVHRIYLTGYSGGAEPIYNYLGSEPSPVVAAVLPISGWYSTQNHECDWSSIPIWYFHGANDGIVPAPDHSTASYDHLIACSPAPAIAPRYTLFSMRAHDDWDLVYDLSGMDAATYPVVATPPGNTPYDVSIYDWFLTHTR
jgi:predicted esterase